MEPDDRSQQVTAIAGLLAHIEVPKEGPYPAIDLVFLGPVERIAGHLYDQGVRVTAPTNS